MSRSRAAAGAASLLALLAVLVAAAPAAGAARLRRQDPPAAPPAAQGKQRVLAIQVEGQERYTEAQLIAALGQKVGEPLDPIQIDQGILRLYESLKVRAEVFFRSVEGVPDAVELRLVVTEFASDREPRFLGNVAIGKKNLLEWAGLEDRSELFLHQADRVKQRLLEGYRREGYAFAEVEVVSRQGNGASTGGIADLIFEIREGPKVRVRAVELLGNRSMPDTAFLYFFKDGLSHYAKRSLKGPSLFNWAGDVFTEEAMEADRVAMLKVYRDRGWLDAVVELKELRFSKDRSRVKIVYWIDEGPRYTVKGVDLAAFTWVKPLDPRSQELAPAELVLPAQELQASLELEAGAVLERSTIERDRRTLSQRYGAAGHVSHPSLGREVAWEFLEPELSFDVVQHQVQVTYRIVQGRPLTLREIRFAGGAHTRDRVLRREVSVFPGGKADLVEINRSLARLQATGYFTDDFNRLEHKDPVFRFLSVPGDPGQVDLEFQVEEGRVIDFQVYGGVDSNDGLFGLVQLTFKNFDASDVPESFLGSFEEIYSKRAFHGGGERLELEIAPGTVVNRARARYVQPDLFGSHLEPISLELEIGRRLRVYDTHDEDRVDKRVRLGRRFGFNTSLHLGYRHTDVDVSDLDVIPPELLEQQDQAGEQQVAGLSLEYGTRSLDNLLVPRQGFRYSASATDNDPAFGSDFEFLDLASNYDVYVPAWEKDDGTSTVFHLEADARVLQPYGDTQQVPFTERFFGGGVKNMRGFDYRGIGPFDLLTGESVGAETYVGGTLEFHYPLHSVRQPGTYRPIESLRGTLFLDWGWFGEESWELRQDDLRVSAGLALGLAWPLPIALSFGFPLVEQDGDEKEVFAFNLGF